MNPYMKGPQSLNNLQGSGIKDVLILQGSGTKDVLILRGMVKVKIQFLRVSLVNSSTPAPTTHFSANFYIIFSMCFIFLGY